MPEDILEINLGGILGAVEAPSTQQLTLYIPDKDKDGRGIKHLHTCIDPDRFEKNLKSLREFLHRFGRETNQGEVAFEFAGEFFRVSKYDSK